MTGSRRDARFGADRDPPTDFERQLLDQVDSLDDGWVEIGKAIGLDALFKLFELRGGEILSVPTRHSFVKRLYIPQRDQEILDERRSGKSRGELAQRYRMSINGVDRARIRALRTRRRPR